MQKKEDLGAKVGSNLPIFCGIVVIVSSGDDSRRGVWKIDESRPMGGFCVGEDKLCR